MAIRCGAVSGFWTLPPTAADGDPVPFGCQLEGGRDADVPCNTDLASPLNPTCHLHPPACTVLGFGLACSCHKLTRRRRRHVGALGPTPVMRHRTRRENGVGLWSGKKFEYLHVDVCHKCFYKNASTSTYIRVYMDTTTTSFSQNKKKKNNHHHFSSTHIFILLFL